jgi:predicted type IV restriction endonuclease
MIGARARCKKCNNIFIIEEHLREPLTVDLGEEHEERKGEDDRKKRKSPKEVMEEHIRDIRQAANEMIPRLKLSLERNDNESDTRLLIDQILQNILGYKIEDIKTEQKVEGRKADYILSVNNQDVIVIEAKRMGMALRDQQTFQATSYGAQSGIKWVVLTNGIVWRLYHISTGDRIETDLVFTIELVDGLDEEEAYYFYLISKNGMSRKNLLHDLWRKISALCYDNIVNAILTEDVILKIRTVLTRKTGFKVTSEDVRNVIENNVFQLS